MRILVILFTLLFIQSWTNAHILTVGGGYSAVESDTSGNTVAVYGGAAGTCTGDGVSPCNSCTEQTGGAHACSLARIYSTLRMSIGLRLEVAIPINAKYALFADTGGSKIEIPGKSSTTNRPMVVGDVLSLDLTWGEFCSQFPGEYGTDCSTSGESYAPKNILIGVDANGNSTIEDAEMKAVSVRLHAIPAGIDKSTNWCPDTTAAASSTGVCQAKVAAGDSKVYIQDLTLGSANYSGAPIDAMAVYAFPATAGSESGIYSSFANGQASLHLLPINSSNTLTTDRITGLNNGQYYCFVIAAANKAKNIYSFTTGGSINVADVCTHPSEVVGLLDDKHCFISTAAFGSPFAKEVEVFRQFRNEFLLNSPLGISFVKNYYKYSPPMADFITQHEGLRTLVRYILYPLYLFSLLSLKLGLVLTTLLFFSLAVILLRFKRKHA